MGFPFRVWGSAASDFWDRGGEPTIKKMCIYIYMYTCIYVYIYIYIYISLSLSLSHMHVTMCRTL